MTWVRPVSQGHKIRRSSVFRFRSSLSGDQFIKFFSMPCWVLSLGVEFLFRTSSEPKRRRTGFVGRRAREFATRGHVTRPGKRPGSTRSARPSVRLLPVAFRDWRRRNGRTIDPASVSPSGPASSRHCYPADQGSRPDPPRLRPCPCETAAPCNPPTRDIMSDQSRATSGSSRSST
jgi:hypothetical protein